jgi:hypothetical protein
MEAGMKGICSAGAAAVVVALAAAQPASAARVYGGQPSGTGQSTAQLVLSLSNSGNELTKVTFHLDVACGTAFRSVDSGTTLSVDSPPDRVRFGAHYLVGAKVRGGRLSGTIVGADQVDDTTIETMSVVLSGTAGKSSARGRLAVRLLRINATTGEVVGQCAKNLSWRALRKPGIVYAGATSQDEPVVIELSADRKRVSHAHLAWFGPCQGGGAWIDPHDEFDLEPFRLSPTGRFARRYEFNLAEATLRERFVGRVSRTRASGTFKADATVPQEAGTDTCSSGTVSWKAATG